MRERTAAWRLATAALPSSFIILPPSLASQRAFQAVYILDGFFLQNISAARWHFKTGIWGLLSGSLCRSCHLLQNALIQGLTPRLD